MALDCSLTQSQLNFVLEQMKFGYQHELVRESQKNFPDRGELHRLRDAVLTIDQKVNDADWLRVFNKHAQSCDAIPSDGLKSDLPVPVPKHLILYKAQENMGADPSTPLIHSQPQPTSQPRTPKASSMGKWGVVFLIVAAVAVIIALTSTGVFAMQTEDSDSDSE